MSRLDGIDISGWNIPIDVVGISADFVIVKVTEGLQGDKYNKWWRDMLDEGAQGGKLLGVYHYANGEDPIAEAESFYSHIKAYRGRVVPALDWEGQGNALYDTGEDVSWCLRFMDRISELMGSTCLLYTSKGECNAYDWSSVAKKYPLWGAEYAYDYCTYQGYEDEPWQSKAKWGAWGTNVTIHQYGYVNPQPNNGGQSQLDADKFYGTKADWQNMCRKGGGMSLRDEVVEAMRSLIGEPYYSMNYGRAEGFGGMGTNYIGEGFGCAEGCTYAFNTTLNTRYKGSVWNFAGDALGDPDVNQGGGEFVFVSEPDAHAGDVVLYLQPGHDGTDATDYSHAAMLVDDYHVVGAWGKGVPGEPGYWPGRGVSEDRIGEQDLGGGRRYVHCTRLDEKPKPEPKQTIPDEGRGAVYRLYDRKGGLHFLTASLDEARNVAGWMEYEGVAFRASGKGQKVYRLYDPGNGDHFLTTSKSERDTAKGWMRYEGVAFKTDGKKPVYRLCDQGNDSHFYTASKDERDRCVKWGWRYEGIAFYAK